MTVHCYPKLYTFKTVFVIKNYYFTSCICTFFAIYKTCCIITYITYIHDNMINFMYMMLLPSKRILLTLLYKKLYTVMYKWHQIQQTRRVKPTVIIHYQ